MKTDTTTDWLQIVPVILVIAVFLFAVDIRAQTSIANTSIELVGNKVQVTYDIANSKRSDRYNVRLEVTDSTGNSVLVHSVEGDVGDNVSGGNKKKIIWNLEADSIQMNADIYFELYADAIVEPEPEPPIEEVVAVQQPEPAEEEKGTALASDPSQKEDLITMEPDQTEDVADSQGDSKKEKEIIAEREFSRAGIILQSLALPGLGLSRAKGGPHWLKGAAGYGAVAAAVFLNKKAVATYEDYKTPGSADEARSLLDKSTRQDNISEICAYAAIGIWVSDLVWTIVGTADLSSGQTAKIDGPISLGTKYDPLSGVPLLAIRIKF